MLNAAKVLALWKDIKLNTCQVKQRQCEIDGEGEKGIYLSYLTE